MQFILPSLWTNAEYYSSGSPHIDQMREEVKASPTTPQNYQERIVLLLNWTGILQRYGADLHPCFEVEQAYFGEPKSIYKFGLRVEESTLCIYRDKVYALSADGYVHAIK